MIELPPKSHSTGFYAHLAMCLSLSACSFTPHEIPDTLFIENITTIDARNGERSGVNLIISDGKIISLAPPKPQGSLVRLSRKTLPGSMALENSSCPDFGMPCAPKLYAGA